MTNHLHLMVSVSRVNQVDLYHVFSEEVPASEVKHKIQTMLKI